MILDRTHRTWAIGSALFMLLSTVGYLLYAWSMPNGPQGGTLVGLAFGAASALMMILAGMLAVVRRFLLFPVGTRQSWLRAHIWLGLLCVPMALFHTGFGLGGTVEQWLWFLTVVVVGSGIWGLVMQTFMPRYMMLRVPEETFNEQVPHRLKILKVECDLAVAGAVGALALPDAPKVQTFLEADQLLHEATSVEEAEARKGKEEVRLPITRTREYLEDYVKWPKDLKPLEKALKVRGKRQIIELLSGLGAELTVLVQVGLERRKLIKTDIWKKLPEFLDGLYGIPVIPAPLPAPALAASPAGVAPAKPAAVAAAPAAAAEPAKPLSKAEMIRQAQMKKIEASEAPVASTMSKADQIRASMKKTLEQIPVPEAPAEQTATPAKPLSKIEQIRLQQLAKKAAAEGAVPGPVVPPGGQAAVDAPVATPGEPAKPMSKIEMIRAQQLKKAAGGAAPAPSPPAATPSAPAPAAEPAPAEEATEPARPLSKIEMIRAQQLKKAAGAATPAPAPAGPPAAVSTPAAVEEPAEPAKPMSKIEMIRAQQLKKVAGDAAPAPAAPAPVPPPAEESVEPTKPLSKIEMIRAQQLAKVKAKDS